MKNNNIDLKGQRFERLLAINKIIKNNKAYWHCKCDCGNEKDILEKSLLKHSVKSCGCYQREIAVRYNKKYNQYDLSNEYGIGYTENIDPTDIEGKRNFFYFDLEDYDVIKDCFWRFDSKGYLVANYKKINEETKEEYATVVKQHRLILNMLYDKTGMVIDHIHHNKYDNRKSELRICTSTQSNHNIGLKKNNKSGIIGVFFYKKTNRWVALIGVTINGKHKDIYLGSYKNKEDAIKARKEAEEEYFGEYSYDNSMAVK